VRRSASFGSQIIGVIAFAALLMLAHASSRPPAPAATASALPTDHPDYRAAMTLAESRRFVEAASAFGILADHSGVSELGGWSRYQQGLCLRAAKQPNAAISVLEHVKSNHPKRHVAALAKEALAGLRGDEPERPPLPKIDPTCGPRCLLYLCRRQKIPATLPELTRRCKTTDHGTTMADLLRTARQKGLRLRGWKIEPAELEKMPLPLVAWVGRSHFVVITGCEKEAVTVWDSASDAEFTESMTQFQKRWDGYVLAPLEGKKSSS
jgi:hypothetical protein